MKLDYKAYNAWALTWLIELPHQRPDLIVIYTAVVAGWLAGLIGSLDQKVISLAHRPGTVVR